MLHQFRALAVAATMVAVSLPLAACSDESKLTIHSENGDHTFNIEIVDTPKTRAEGLMYRQELAPDAGMLFDFLAESSVSFWMRNTFIPLDMLFITSEGVVKNIHVNARPHDPTGIPSDGPVQFVLEIPGGRSVELGIEAGDTVTHPRIVAAQ